MSHLATVVPSKARNPHIQQYVLGRDGDQVLRQAQDLGARLRRRANASTSTPNKLASRPRSPLSMTSL